jgi:hypothetical protein
MQTMEGGLRKDAYDGMKKRRRMRMIDRLAGLEADRSGHRMRTIEWQTLEGDGSGCRMRTIDWQDWKGTEAGVGCAR